MRLWRNLLMVVTVLGLLLTACGGGGEETPTPSPVPTRSAVEETPMPGLIPTASVAEHEPGTIRFAVYDSQQAVYEDLIEAFEEANPGLHVQLVSLDKLESPGRTEWPDWAVRLFSAADVAEMWVWPGMDSVGLVRDLMPFIEADPNFQPGDFYPGTLEAYQWDGGAWALPLAIDFELICYDKEAFDEAGEFYPEPGWTWDDFLAKAKALTVREGDEVTCWGFALPPVSDPTPFIKGRVGPLVDTTSDPPTIRLDRAEVIEAVRWYTDLLKEKVMILPEMREGSDGTMVWDSRMLYDGQLAAMWVDTFSGWQWNTKRGPIGVVSFPVDAPDSRTTPVSMQSRTIVMSAGTRQPDAAWRWMDFLSRQSTSGRRGQYLPARRSVAETSGFWDNLDEELATTLRYAVDHSYTIRREIEDDAVSRALRRALDTILKEGKSVEEAMAEAQVQAVAGIQEGYAYLAKITPVPPFVVAPPEGQAPAGQEAVTITFAPGLGSLAMQRYRNLAKRFHETHPDVLVEVKMPGFPITPSDLQSFANVADCFLGYPSLHNQQNRAAILDLGSLLDADPSFTTDDFYSPVLEQFTWQGQLWGLPAEVGPYVIEYNKALFDDAGLDYPTLDGSTELAEVWTPDEFLSLAVALTRGEGEDMQYGFMPEVYEGNVLPLILERLGARLIDDSVAPPAFSFDDPATAEALRWYANLASVHGVRPVFVTDLAELEEALPFQEREALINEGRAAMWTSTSSQSAIAYVRSGLDIGVVPLPAKRGGTGGYLSARGYFISAQTEARQACWQWLTFLTEQPEAVQGLPARRTVAESEAYRQQVGEERAAAYLASVAGLERPFQIFSEDPWLRGATYWLFQAYGQVLDGKASVEEALSTAQGMADDYRACVIARDAFSHQEDWQVCLKEVDPTLPDFLVGAGAGEE